MGNDEHKLIAKMAVIELGLDKEWSKASKQSFFQGDTSGLEAFKETFGEEVYQVAKNACNANYKRYKRVHDKVDGLVSNGNGYFLTLTFTDDVLANTTEATRRKYVSRILKKYFPFYVANIDYGSEKGREHYHAIVWSFFDPRSPETPFEWPYGFKKVQHIGVSEKDGVKTCKYLTKLTRHSLKETGKGKRLIYSR